MRAEVLNRPGRAAILAACAYSVLATAWIVWTSSLAASNAAGVEELAHTELLKGAGFALASGIFFGAVLYLLLTRIARIQRALAEAQQALVVVERRTLAGVLASSVAHDCNNLLQILVAQLAELEETLGRAQGGKGVELQRPIAATADQIAALMRRLAAAGKRHALGDLRRVSLASLVEENVDLLRPYARARGRQLELVLQAPGPVEADAALLQQAVTNLVLNALDAAHRVRVRVGAEDGLAFIEVEDDGPGIPAEDRERVFESFYTTKGHGTGLGLLSARFAAQAHGGAISIGDSPLGGAAVRLEIPRVPPADAPVRTRDAEARRH